MSRKIFIGNIDGTADECKDFIKRHSEDRVHFDILSKEILVKHELTKDIGPDTLMFFVPFLNKYQGLALYVPSNVRPKIEVDKFFSYKVHQNLGSIVYFKNHDVWLFDCGTSEAKFLNPFYLNENDLEHIKNDITISIIDSI